MDCGFSFPGSVTTEDLAVAVLVLLFYFQYILLHHVKHK